MKLRIIAAGLCLAAFTLALATLIRTDAVKGTARAADAAGHHPYITVDAARTTHNTAVSLRGTFDLYLPGATSADSLRVHLNVVDVMGVVDNHGELGGPGVLRVQHGSDLHYYEGRVYLSTFSNRHAGEAGPMDTVAVHFVPAVQSNPSYVFEGNVPDGDIAVSSNFSY